MPTRDAYSRTKVVQLLPPTAITADTWSLALDLASVKADGVLIVASVGELGSDATNTLAITLQEAADGETITTASDYSAVAAADIEGTELAVTVALTGESTTYAAGYKGTARYLAVKFDESNTISGPVAAYAILTYLHEAPPANFTVTTGQPA